MKTNLLWYQQILEGYAELSKPIRIPLSVTFTVIRFPVFIRLQNCSGINWGKVVRALINVHCRSPSMNFAASSKQDWLKYCNSKRHWWKKGTRWVLEAHGVPFKNLLVQKNSYVFAMVSAPTIDPSLWVDLSQIVCWVRSRTSTPTRRSNQLTESDQKRPNEANYTLSYIFFIY